MLVLSRKRTERIAVFLDGEFAGWFSIEEIRRQRRGSQDRARIGLEFDDSFQFVREEILTDDQKRLTRAIPLE